tara:strand:- start:332 stop:1519 length:1188 start_codon:yes stop_codon:yes gene_type:complete
MISVQQALQIILNNTQDFGVEETSFLKSVGRVLKENILADRDFPPFNRVSMDGIAINQKYFLAGNRDFLIEGIQAAGAKQKVLKGDSNCMEVMTGAVLPQNTDTVIRYEDVVINNGIATINLESVEQGKNIHDKGKDRSKGDLLIKQNTIITAAEIGVIATVGKSMVKVAKTPKVIIVSTGDELVEVHEIPLAHQIRRSNAFTLVSLLEKLNIKADTSHISDDKELLKQKIDFFLNNYDILLLSGAVSKGKYDFLPEVLEELQVEKLFHKVAQRPGKPFWYGRKQGKPVFAFPGNPISTYVNCLVYFYPWFAKSIGVEFKHETVILGEDVSFKPQLTYFLQVRVDIKVGQLVAFPIKGNGSGDLASLVEADGFIQLPKEQINFKKDEIHSFIRYR